jgi:hypothetical protein
MGRVCRAVHRSVVAVCDLRRAAEVAITSTAGGIMPVTLIDGQPVGPGTPGPRTTSLRERYWARHENPGFSAPVRYDGQGLQARPEHRTPGHHPQ